MKVFALLLLAGCTTTIRGYEGEPRPREELAVIVCHTAKAQRVVIRSIDGRVVDRSVRGGDCLELLQGTHSIRVGSRWTTGLWGGGIHPVDWGMMATDAASARAGEVIITAPLQAGHRYILDVRNPEDGIVAYELTDAETDELIAGERLRGVFAFQR